LFNERNTLRKRSRETIALGTVVARALTAQERRCAGRAVSAYSAHKRKTFLRRIPAELNDEALPFLEIMIQQNGNCRMLDRN
jgi:acyl-CoA reductase-like NAD-dependent aldehyde dehydrogenase